MHVFITTLGSRGDVQPYVALGAGLERAGHRVTLSTAARFAPAAAEHGLAFAPTTNALLDLLDAAPVREAMETMTNAFEVAKRVRSMVRLMRPVQETLVAESWEAVQAVAPELIVYHPKAFWGPAFAHALGVPVVQAPLQPFFVPTGESPAIGFPALPLGARYRRRTHDLLVALRTWGTERYLAGWRREHGAPARARGANALHTIDGRPIPTVHGISRHVVPEPTDWPPHVVMDGYWALEAPGWSPAPDLQAFLDAGPPPVYVGFGSMAGRTPERTTGVVVEALARAGARGLVATGWGGLDRRALPDGVFAIEGAPHDALFPHVAAVVHHGGAGTTAAGLRAGRPSVVCPFFGDQPFWGRRVHALGAGPAPILQKRLTAEALAAAIREATTFASIRQRAEALGAALRAEDGVGTAVRLIEAWA